jgi:chemotaxis protein MotB
MAGKGGGAWKVAYADFVTAMMAFFLVMWITAQNKETKSAVAQYFVNPLGTVEGARASSVHGIEGASADAPLEGEQAGPHGTNKDGVGDENNADKSDAAKTPPPPQRIFERLDKTRSLGTMLVFGQDDAAIAPDARQQLLRLIPQIAGKPNKIEIRGHASRQPLAEGSPFSSAWELCFARCSAVRDLMISHGIEPERLRLSQDGNSEPYGAELHDDEVKELASRVEVFAVSEFAHGSKESLRERVGRLVEADEVLPSEEGEVAPHSSEHADGEKSGHGHAKPAAHAPKSHKAGGGH